MRITRWHIHANTQAHTEQRYVLLRVEIRGRGRRLSVSDLLLTLDDKENRREEIKKKKREQDRKTSLAVLSDTDAAQTPAGFNMGLE